MRNARQQIADAGFGILGILLLAAAWSGLHTAFGKFVLPSLGETALALERILNDGALAALAVTLGQAIGGAAAGTLIGFVLGVISGFIRPIGATLQPALTAILGIPPVAWVVLALLWFGPGGFSPLFTVMMATLPIIFVATTHGVRARDANLLEMGQVFRLSARTQFMRIILPGLIVHIAPALSTVFALSWKVALTAEVLGDGTGIGGRFATARAFLDLPEAMAWIVLVVVFVLLTDGLLLGSLRRWTADHGGRAAKLPSAAYSCPTPKGHSDA